MNVVVVKMRECLLDAYTGKNDGPLLCTTYLTHNTCLASNSDIKSTSFFHFRAGKMEGWT